MRITETDKGNIKLVMTKEEFTALYGLVDFPMLSHWATIARDTRIKEALVSDVWEKISDYFKAHTL